MYIIIQLYKYIQQYGPKIFLSWFDLRSSLYRPTQSQNEYSLHGYAESSNHLEQMQVR